MGTQLNTRISWGRIVIAAVASEIAVMALLTVVMLGYRFVIASGHPAFDYTAFNDAAGFWVAPLAAGPAVLFGALWACRASSGRLVLTGTLVGLTAVLLTGAFVFFAKPDDRLMYGVSYVLRVIGGWAGGILAQRARTKGSASQFQPVDQGSR
jgi:hypothetical protein